jgi:hypothetical protein
LARLLKELGLSSFEELTSALDNQIKNQNLLSSSCIKSIGSFIRNQKKIINSKDLEKTIEIYETSFEFIKEDIEKYKA